MLLYNVIYNTMTGKRLIILFTGIIIIGAFLRLYTSERHIKWGPDQYYDVILWERLARTFPKSYIKSTHPFAGQEGLSISRHETEDEAEFSVYNGIFYTYLLLPVAIVTEFNPYYITLFSIFLYLLSAVLMYKVGTLLFRERVGILSSFLFATSYWTVDFSRSYWTPTPIPFFILLALYSLARIVRGDRRYWIPAAFAASATSQLHNSGYVFLFFFLLVVPFILHRRNTGIRVAVASVICFIIPLIPTLYTEFSTDLTLVNGIYYSFTNQLSRLYPVVNLHTVLITIPWDILHAFILFIVYSLGFIARVEAFSDIRPFLVLAAGMGFVLILPSILKSHKEYGLIPFGPKFVLIWLMFIVPLPWIVRVYYNLSAKGFGTGNMVGLLQCMPFLFLFVGWWFSRKSLTTAAIMGNLLFFSVFTYANISATTEHMMENTDAKYNFGAEYSIAEYISDYSRNRPYELNYSIRRQPGSQILYFFHRYSMQLPERFNGSHIPAGNNPSLTNLPNGTSEILYTIVSQKDIDMYISEDIGDPVYRAEQLILYGKKL